MRSCTHKKLGEFAFENFGSVLFKGQEKCAFFIQGLRPFQSILEEQLFLIILNKLMLQKYTCKICVDKLKLKSILEKFYNLRIILRRQLQINDTINCKRSNNFFFQVITKFIKKSQVYKDSWTVDPNNEKKLCLEVDLLLKLDHPNIVSLNFYFYLREKCFVCL